AIGVEKEREVRAAVGIVFQPLDLGHDAILVAAKVNDAVVALVTAPLVSCRDVAVAVAARAALLADDELVDRTALVQVGIDDLDHGAPARRSRFDFDEWHGVTPLARS